MLSMRLEKLDVSVDRRRAMSKVENTGHKRHVCKRVQSPVGRLTLVATEDGLAAILWENDHPSRVRLNIAAEDNRHPVLLETERQLQEYFDGRRKQFALVTRSRRDGLSASGVERVADHTVWRDAILRTNREADRASASGARRRCGEWPKSGFDCRAVPPRRRVHGSPHGIRRRPRREGTPAGIRVRSLACALCRLIAAPVSLLDEVPPDDSRGRECSAAVSANHRVAPHHGLTPEIRVVPHEICITPDNRITPDHS